MEFCKELYCHDTIRNDKNIDVKKDDAWGDLDRKTVSGAKVKKGRKCIS